MSCSKTSNYHKIYISANLECWDFKLFGKACRRIPGLQRVSVDVQELQDVSMVTCMHMDEKLNSIQCVSLDFPSLV